MRTATVSAALLSLLCIPVSARANDWTELRSDGSGSRATREASGTAFEPAWSYTVKSGGRLVATPISVDGLVIVAGVGSGIGGDLAAVGLADGKERWARVIDVGLGSTPAVLNGRLVTSSLGGQLYGLDLQTGAIRWQRAFGGGMNYSSPALVADGAGGPGTVILPAGFPSQDVSRIDLATGEPTWRTAAGAIAGLIYTSAAVVGQQAIVGMENGSYQSLDLQTGATRWVFSTGGTVDFSSPLVVGDTVYMFPADSMSRLFAAKVDGGQPVSGFPIAIPDPAPVVPSDGMLGRGPATSPPMTAGGLIIFQMRRQDMQNTSPRTFNTVMREYVVAVDPRLMKVVWQHQVGNVVARNLNDVPELNTCPTPAAFSTSSGPMIAVSSSIAARIAVLDVATGEERWSAPLASPGRSSPIFSNGLLVVGTDVGVLQAFSSSFNRAPAAPSGLMASSDAASGNVVLAWNAASDPEGQALSYVVRVIENGDVTETETSAGQTTFSIVPKANTTYQVSVRARDPKGALSAPTAGQSVQSGEHVPNPPAVPSDAPAIAGVPPEPTTPPAAPPQTADPVNTAPTSSTETIPEPPLPMMMVQVVPPADSKAGAQAGGCSAAGGDSGGTSAFFVALAFLAFARRWSAPRPRSTLLSRRVRAWRRKE
jgi:outer membrane protein assembly factor BamB